MYLIVLYTGPRLIFPVHRRFFSRLLVHISFYIAIFFFYGRRKASPLGGLEGAGSGRLSHVNSEERYAHNLDDKDCSSKRLARNI